MQLRDYQKQCVAKMVWARQLPGADLISLPTGSGKSLVISELAKQLNEPILILVPSKELLEQDQQKLSHWTTASVYSAGSGSKEIGNITLATIQSAYKNPELFTQFKVVIVDECFVAGTKIGNKNIEDIKVGDYVDSFNHKTGIIEKKKVLATSKKELKQELYLTSLIDNSIISTGNHPVYVKDCGYIQVKDLIPGDIVYANRNLSTTNTRISNSNPLLHRMRAAGFPQRQSPIVEIQENQQSISQGVLMDSKGRFHKQNKNISTYSLFRKISYRNVSKIEINRAQANYPGGQWETYATGSKKTIDLSWGKLVSRVCYQDKPKKGKYLTSSNITQDRLSKPQSENSDRNRRGLTQFCREEISRPEERDILVAKRVESIKVYKQGSKQEDGKNSNTTTHVYNLQVEDNNNYFANNILAHNCDLINPKNLAGMYNKLFKGMENPKIYGLTATPFRMDSFYRSWGRAFWQKESVHTVKILTRYRDRFWSRMLYVAHNQDLIDKGYLVPLTYHKINLLTQDQLSFNKSKSEFDMEDFEEKFNPFLNETAKRIRVIKGQVLVFCATIKQAENLAEFLPESVIITGATPAKERARIVEGFRNGTIRVVLNVGVLLVGFDKPDLSNIVICRPTRSLRLHMQLLGRGMRPSPNKTTCDIYDMVGNIDFLGEAESMRIEKVEDKWNITTKTKPEGWHYAEIYSFKLKKPIE